MHEGSVAAGVLNEVKRWKSVEMEVRVFGFRVRADMLVLWQDLF